MQVARYRPSLRARRLGLGCEVPGVSDVLAELSAGQLRADLHGTDRDRGHPRGDAIIAGDAVRHRCGGRHHLGHRVVRVAEESGACASTVAREGV